MRHDRSWRLGRRGAVTMLLAALILSALGAVALAAVRPDGDAARLFAASGRVKITNSLGGRAVVGMHGMLPGDSTTGVVRIGNASKVKVRMYLGLSRLIEERGTGGGSLSMRLLLVVKRISTTRRPQLVYYGPLRRLPLLSLGTFAPRSSRSYKFTVVFPEAGPSIDNRYQAGRVSLQFSWYARQAR